MSNHTKKLVSNLQLLMHRRVSSKECKQVSRCLLDYLGATYAGAKLLEDKSTVLTGYFGAVSNGILPVGLNTGVSLETAALINGLHSHAAEMDDGVRFGMVHPGAPIFSALLPVAEMYGVSGRDFIRGVLVGYDATLRFASAMQPSHYRRGYHPTATCGSIGATMGIAAMLEFSVKEMEDALGAVTVSASGSLKVVDNGSELKPFNVGRAAALAIQSSLMGKAAFASPEDVLMGDTGFLKMVSDSVDLCCLYANAPNNYWIHSVYVKPYAACRHAHPSIEAALEIRQQSKFQIHEIKKIEVITYHGLKGRHDGKDISSISSARMSIPFSIALALKAGGAGIQDFTHAAVNDQAIKKLAEKVIMSESQKYTNRVPDQRSAEFIIELTDGTKISREVVHPKGEPENPLSDSDLEAKFHSLTSFGGVPEEYSAHLKDLTLNISDDLTGFLTALQACNVARN